MGAFVPEFTLCIIGNVDGVLCALPIYVKEQEAIECVWGVPDTTINEEWGDE